MRRPGPLHLLVAGLIWPPETFVERRLAGLAARGFRVTVAVSFVRGADPRIPGVRVVRVPAGRLRALWCALVLLVRRPRRVPALWRAARGSGRWRHFLPLAALDPDVAHFEWEKWAVTHLPLAAVWGCPLTMSCHGGIQVHVHSPVPPRSLVTPLLPAAFEAVQAIHCVCEPLRDLALERGADPAKVTIIPSAVDPDDFTPASAQPEDAVFRVVTVAWLRWLKGMEYALEALALVGPGVRLDIYGGDPLASSPESSERPRLVQAIEELGLRDRVTLHGHVPPAGVLAAMRRSHVLLHPSLSEGMPTVVLEAMSCAVPVVATDVGGVREAVRDGVEGLVVPPRDPAAMASALHTLRADPALRMRMGAAGRSRVRSAFTLDMQLDRFERFYRTAADTEHGTVPLGPRMRHLFAPSSAQPAAQPAGPDARSET